MAVHNQRAEQYRQGLFIKIDATMRRELILEAAVKVALLKGLASVNYQDVANACSVPTSKATVRRYCVTLPDLYREIAERVQRSGRPYSQDHKAILDTARHLSLIE